MKSRVAKPNEKSAENLIPESKMKTNLSKKEKKMGKKSSSQIHPKSAPVSLERRHSSVTCQTFPQSNVKKAIFTKIHSKSVKKVENVLDLLDVDSTKKTKWDQSTHSSSGTGPSLKPKKNLKKIKKLKKKGKGKKEEVKEIAKVEEKLTQEENDSKQDESEIKDEDVEEEISFPPVRKRIYRSHLRIPGQSFQREEIEDPLTLVEAEFLSEGKSRLQMMRRNLSLDITRHKQFLKSKPIEDIKKSDQEIVLTPERIKQLEDLYYQSTKQSRPTSVKSQKSSTDPLSFDFRLQTSPLIPSKETVRFTIPMDARLLKNITPSNYLRNYTIPASYFSNICKRIFEKHKLDKNLPIKFLRKSLSETVGYQLKDDQFDLLLNLIDIREEKSIDFKLFVGCTGLLVRLLSHELTNNKSQRDHVEKLDFDLLLLNFNLFSINEKTKNILQFLQSM